MNTNTVISTSNSNGTSAIHNADAAQNNASDIIPGTNWTYGDAASMAKECMREERLFGNKSRKAHSPRRTRLTTTQRAAAFLKQTGWTIEDAASMAKSCMRDRRLFGGLAMYATA
jgi:hypothetical protein